jgi:hypothetical protein
VVSYRPLGRKNGNMSLRVRYRGALVISGGLVEPRVSGGDAGLKTALDSFARLR